jgi:hypothetical protein
MNSVGTDLHRKRSHVAVVDGEGREVPSRRIANDPATFLGLLEGIDGESKIALEATYGWEWLAELLEQAGYELRLARPLRTRAIAAARVKTDAVDARTLAHLLRADLLPEAYVAPRELRDLRDLLRHRVALTQLRTALKNPASSRSPCNKNPALAGLFEAADGIRTHDLLHGKQLPSAKQAAVSRCCSGLSLNRPPFAFPRFEGVYREFPD